jgi:O-antigen/teichoic acid export membrane protein
MTQPATAAGAMSGRSVGRGQTDVAVRTARNVAANTIAQVVGKGGTFVWTVVAARQLTPEEFGLFNLVLAVALLVSAGAEWGFDPMLVRRASQRPDRLEQHYAEAVSWQSAIGVPVFITGAVVMSLVRPDEAARWTVALLFLAVFLDLWSDTSRATSAAALDQTTTATALVVQRLATMLLAVPVLLAGGGTAALAGAVLVAYAVGWLAHQLALRRLGIRFRSRLVTKAGMRAFVRGTGIVGLNALILMALFRLDALLLAEMQGERALGAYAAAYRLFETSLFLTFAVSSAVYPVMSARAEHGSDVRGQLEEGLAVVAAVYLPFAAICLVDAEGVLDLLYGAVYAESSAAALRWLALAPMAFAIAYLASAAVTAMNRTRILLLGAASALLTNLTLNLLLIPRFSGTGAAFATVAAYTVEVVVMLGLLAAFLGRVRVARPLLEPAIASAVLALCLWLSPLPTAVTVALGAMTYAIVWWVLTRRFSPQRLGLLKGAAAGRWG